MNLDGRTDSTGCFGQRMAEHNASAKPGVNREIPSFRRPVGVRDVHRGSLMHQQACGHRGNSLETGSRTCYRGAQLALVEKGGGSDASKYLEEGCLKTIPIVHEGVFLSHQGECL
jgi:hypothetical protein